MEERRCVCPTVARRQLSCLLGRPARSRRVFPAEVEAPRCAAGLMPHASTCVCRLSATRWSVHRHASRLKSKVEEPGVVLKKRNAAPGVHVIVPLRVNTNQPPTNHRKPSGARPSPPLTHVRRPPLEAYHRPRRSREPPLGRAQGVGPRRLRQSEPTHPSGSPAARGPLAPTRREALPGCVSHLSTT